MSTIGTDQLEAFLAFGRASIAVAEVSERVSAVDPADQISHDFVELEAAHARLRVLFAEGHDDAVCALARHVLILVKQSTTALDEDGDRAGL